MSVEWRAELEARSALAADRVRVRQLYLWHDQLKGIDPGSIVSAYFASCREQAGFRKAVHVKTSLPELWKVCFFMLTFFLKF